MLIRSAQRQSQRSTRFGRASGNTTPRGLQPFRPKRRLTGSSFSCRDVQCGVERWPLLSTVAARTATLTLPLEQWLPRPGGTSYAFCNDATVVAPDLKLSSCALHSHFAALPLYGCGCHTCNPHTFMRKGAVAATPFSGGCGCHTQVAGSSLRRSCNCN